MNLTMRPHSLFSDKMLVEKDTVEKSSSVARTANFHLADHSSTFLLSSWVKLKFEHLFWLWKHFHVWHGLWNLHRASRDLGKEVCTPVHLLTSEGLLCLSAHVILSFEILRAISSGLSCQFRRQWVPLVLAPSPTQMSFISQDVWNGMRWFMTGNWIEH